MASSSIKIAHRTVQSTSRADFLIPRRVRGARQHNGSLPRASLINLPTELLLDIVSFLPSPFDIVAFRKSCKRFSTATSAPYISRKHYNRKQIRRAMQILQRRERNEKGKLLCAACLALHEDSLFESEARGESVYQRACTFSRAQRVWF